MEERFNAVPNAGSFNCPICYRAKALVESVRSPGLWRCVGYTDETGGCWATFRLIPAIAGEYSTLERVRFEAPRRQTVEEHAERRERFFR